MLFKLEIFCKRKIFVCLKEIEDPSKVSVEEEIIQKDRIYNKDHKQKRSQYEEAVNNAAGKLA